MTKVKEMPGRTWPVWLAGVLVLAAILGLGLYRHPPGDDDDAAMSVAPGAIRPGEVRLDMEGLDREGISEQVPQRLKGKCLVPVSALLFVDGKECVYVETAPGEFTRQEVEQVRSVEVGISCDIPGWKAGQAVVTQGAAILLSQEMKPKSPAGGGDDDD